MAGRPTKYDEAFCKVAEDTLSQGYSLAVLAGDCDVCLDTIHEWVKQHPEFSDAIKRGRAKGARVWEDRLKTLAEKNEGNVTAVIFGLKNRIPAEWKDKTETELSGGVRVSRIELVGVRPSDDGAA